jgi:hypothetical protein
MTTANSQPDFAFGFIVGGNGKDSDGGGSTGESSVLQSLNSTSENIVVNLGGPGGAGVNTSNTVRAGGAGSRMFNWSGVANTAAVAGTASGGNGNPGVANYADRMTHSERIKAASPTIAIGSSGSSGGSHTTGNGGNGGAGGNYGAPGGGGGATRNGYTSGAGGNGSNGFCLVLEYTIS